MISIPNRAPPTPPRRYIALVDATAAGDVPVRSSRTIELAAPNADEAERAALIMAGVTYPRRMGWRVVLTMTEVFE